MARSGSCSYRHLKLSVRESQQQYNDLYRNPDERPEKIILRNILEVCHLPTKNRKFRLGCKWKTRFWFVPLENFRNKWNFCKGTPVFPLETFRWKCVFHLQLLKGLTTSRLFTATFLKFWRVKS